MPMPLTLLALLIAACGMGAPAAASRLQQVPSGEWGGEHVKLTVDERGGFIEFDCGHGSLDEPLRLDAAGRFDVKGTHARESGAARVDAQDPQPARYTGTSDGKTMELTMKVEGVEPSGPFQLALGQEAGVRKCM